MSKTAEKKPGARSGSVSRSDTKLTFGPISYAPESIPQKCERGSRIRIYYRPDSVEDAVLSPGNHRMDAYAIFFGLAFVVFGSLSPIHALLMWRTNRLLKTAEQEMREFVGNIETGEWMLDELRDNDRAAYEALLARHQNLIDEFETLYGDCKEFSQEALGDMRLDDQ